MNTERLYILKRKLEGKLQSIPFFLYRIFPINQKKIVFCCIEGATGYSCNPKYISEELIRQKKDYELVWLVNDTTKEFPSQIIVKKNTLWNRAYQLTTAKIWIDNSRKQLEVRKRKGQIYIQTWHAKLGFKPTCLDRGKSFTRIAYLVALMLVPGFPKPILIILGVALILGGYAISRGKKQELALQAEAEEQKKLEEIKAANAQGDSNYYRDIDNVFKLLSVEQIEMEFGYSLLHLVDEKSGGNFIDRVVLFRKQFALDMGMVIPSVRMRNNPEINPNQYVIKIKGEEVARGEILVDHLLALDNGEVTKPVEGIDTIEPAFGIPAKWISEDKKVMADIAGYTLIDPVSVMITHLSEVIKAHCSEILSRQDVRTMVENVKKTDSTIVEDLVPAVISYGYLQKILCMLLAEGVPIRDMETILECLGDHAATLKDMELTVEYVRQSLKRTITRRFSDGGSLRVITLDPKLEDVIIAGVKKNSSGGSVLSIDPETVNAIVANTSDEIDKVKDVLPSIIILMSPFTRIYYKKLLDQFMPGITVLSYSEIDNNTQIQAVGNISI